MRTCLIVQLSAKTQIDVNNLPIKNSYYGFWYGDDVADVGNIHYFAYRDNLILELSLSGKL